MQYLDRRRFLLAAAPPLLALSGAACTTASTSRGAREYRLVAAPARAAVRGPAQPAIDAWAYNGQVPGPLLRARQGERLRVVVENRLPQATTVHWHGLRVPNAMDGVPHLTQPPIAPGGRFVYEFDLPDAGTYWYHSHLQSAEQLERGLAGALIVDEHRPPRVDRDLLWVLDDWRLARDGSLDERFTNLHDMAHAGRIGNTISVNGAPPADVPVRRGERIRLRLVNVANARVFALGFDGHAPQVIALDGQPVTPHAPPGGRVTLGPGMRCDLMLDAMGRPGERHAVYDSFNPRAAFDLLHLAYASQTLREQPLDDALALDPNPLPPPELSQARVHRLRFEGGMMGAMHQALLDGVPLDMRGLLARGKAWSLNGIVSSGHQHGPPLFTLERGRTHVLQMVNDTRWHHPIHLHGHSFRVVRRNRQPTTHGEWRDTVLMNPMESVDIAFVADNPGDWMLHCHVLEHQEGGMMGVFRVA